MSDENHGRGRGLPITPDYAEHLHWQADRSSDGVWVHPDVLAALVSVFEAARTYVAELRDPRATREEHEIEARGALCVVIDAARAPR